MRSCFGGYIARAETGGSGGSGRRARAPGRHAPSGRIRALACAIAGLVALAGAHARGEPPPGFVSLAVIAPAIVRDIRYAGSNNFTGRPVPGYAAAACWLRREAAAALALIEADLAPQGLGLVVYDCYRPQRATDAFVRWAADAGDEIAKARFYPAVEKRTLFAYGYIARRSSHSTGMAVDVGLVRLLPGAEPQPLDFGTPFDRFDPASATASPAIGGEARANRLRLVAAMARRGFANYRNEWWHFSLPGAADARLWDVEIR
jgi:D-alanyl-D-alanine dipeptidase